MVFMMAAGHIKRQKEKPMKKACFLFTIILICALLASCATKAAETAKLTEAAVDDTIHVATFPEFVDAFKTVQSDPTKTRIALDNDIVWDFTMYAGGDYVFSPDVTGLDIDLCGFSITEVPRNAFNLTGARFILQNGSIIASSRNDRYSVNINYNGTNGLKEEALAHVPAAYSDSDPVWANRIVVKNIKATGMLCGYSTMEIKDCAFEDGLYRGLVMQGSSGTVENVKAITNEEGASAGFVAHSYGTVLVKGNCQFKGKFGVYSAQCSTLSFAEDAAVSIGAWATYGIYLEKQGFATIGAGITVQPAEGRQTIYARTGSTLVIEKGAVLKDSAGNELPVPLPAESININNSAGESDADWKGAGTAAEITDNR